MFNQFKRWWLFFRREAFVPDGQGKTFVQRVNEGSATYERVISDKLKELVFEEIMPEIAGGFVAFRREERGVQEETPETLDEIYRASLSLLYKLLFIAYAEARALLPVNHPGYKQVSLTALAEWAAYQADHQIPVSDATHATSKYNQLLDLFHRIDRADAVLGVPQYNGGLFNPHRAENQFLEAHKLSDRAVARAVDLLIRDAGEPVDYAYIGVRNLGAIYEGLLENKLHLTPGPLPPPAGGEGSRRGVELVNDKGERKATGSYYTPDYIVEYIVQHTLGPVLDARETEFRAGMGRIAEIRARLENVRDHATASRLRVELEGAERVAREAFLGIKVLDPAMGSGHFLVNAVDYLTDEIIARMQAFHDEASAMSWDWNPIQRTIEQVRQEIGAEMRRQGLTVDPTRLDDTALLTRLVMKRCIYGVDLNPMAVELAKVSLWLHSFTVGAPLSFLDHHLRWGNSLIGTDVRTVEASMRLSEQKGGGMQFNLFGGPFAGLLDLTAMMTEVAGRADATLADVRQSAQQFDNFQALLTPYKQILDLWVSVHFGNKDAKEFLELFGGNVLPALRGTQTPALKYEQAIERAKDLWAEKRFFHWDLEFPEVFVDLEKRDWAKNPGFDAVIGNPPYGLIDAMPWFGKLTNDAFVYFWILGVQRGKNGGFLSLITPTAWLTGINYSTMRKMLLDSITIKQIIGLPYDVFEGAYIDTCVAVAKVGEQSSHQVLVKQMGKREDATKIDSLTYDAIEIDYWRNDPHFKFVLISEVAKLQRFNGDIKFIQLGEIIRVERGVQPYSGSKHTKQQIQNDFLRLHRKPAQDELNEYYPELLGNELSRYRIEPENKSWLKYSNELASKRDEIFFKGPRVVLRRLLSRRRELMAATTSEKFITTDNILNILIKAEDYSEAYISALLNSKLVAWLYTNTSTISVKDDFPQVTYEELKNLPIRRIAFTTPTETRLALLAEITSPPAPLPKAGEGSGVLAFVDAQLNAQPERADVVHDLLAWLAEQMITLNKEKQAEMKGFLEWVETMIQVPVEDLTGKSFLQNYLGDYQKGEGTLSTARWFEILEKNRGIIRVDTKERAFREPFQKEYQGSLAKLLPIKEKLAGMDGLIDQIVYRLYGLREEEVAVVEGRTEG